MDSKSVVPPAGGVWVPSEPRQVYYAVLTIMIHEQLVYSYTIPTVVL